MGRGKSRKRVVRNVKGRGGRRGDGDRAKGKVGNKGVGSERRRRKDWEENGVKEMV